MTTPGPEIRPLTAPELDDLETRLALHETRRPTVLLGWEDTRRLFAGCRQAEQWKNAADLAIAGERARERELAAVRLDLAGAQRACDDARKRLAGLAGHGPEAPTMVENRYQYGMLMLTDRQPTPPERLAWKAIAVDGVVVKNAYGECGPVSPAGPYFDIVFDGPPGPEAGRFVEVEDEHGHSISVGRWLEPADGTELWRLRITPNDLKSRRPSEDWAAVTRQLGERVARLEAVGQLLEVKTATLDDMDKLGRPRVMPQPSLDDLGPSELAAEMRRRFEAERSAPPSKFADILKSPGFLKMAQEHTIREVFGDAMLANWLMNGGQRTASAPEASPAAAAPPDPQLLDEETAILLLRTMLDERVSPQYEATIVRTDRVYVLVGGRTYLLCGVGAVTAYELIRRARPSRYEDGTLVSIVEMFAGRRLEIRLPDDVKPPADPREADLAEAAQTIEGLRATMRADAEAGQKWIAELQDKLTETERRISDQASTIERLQKTEERTLAQKVADAEIKTLQRERDKLKHDLEMAQHDREQAEQDAEAGATMIARAERQRAKAGSALVNDLRDGAHINLAMEAEARAKGQRDAALAALASIAYMLRVDRGESVEQTRDRIVAKLDEVLAPPSQKILTDAESRQCEHGDLARRIRESDHMRRSWAWSSDADPRDQETWLATATDGDLLDTVFARLEAADRTSAMVNEIDQMFSFEKLEGAQMIAEGSLKERAAAALAHARTEGRREADVERAALVAKLALVREALGATLQPDGTDDVVDKARASASRGVPEILDRELEWFSVAEAIAIRLGIPAEGTPGVAREAILAAVTKLQAGQGTEETSALVAKLAEAHRQVARLLHDFEVERKAHAHNRDLLSQSNQDHNFLLVQLHRIRAALRIQVDTPWPVVADRVIALDTASGALVIEAQKLQAKLDDIKARPFEFLHGLGYAIPGGGSVTIQASPTLGSGGSAPGGTGQSARPEDMLVTEHVGTVDAKLGALLPPLAKLPRPPALLASEQILREVITAAMASGPSPADVFEVRHRLAGAETPPRTELHVFAGKGPMAATTQVLAYVELGQLWLVALDGLVGYAKAQHLSDRWRWPERIRAALDRK